jgi:hypothetical protein
MSREKPFWLWGGAFRIYVRPSRESSQQRRTVICTKSPMPPMHPEGGADDGSCRVVPLVPGLAHWLAASRKHEACANPKTIIAWQGTAIASKKARDQRGNSTQTNISGTELIWNSAHIGLLLLSSSLLRRDITPRDSAQNPWARDHFPLFWGQPRRSWRQPFFSHAQIATFTSKTPTPPHLLDFLVHNPSNPFSIFGQTIPTCLNPQVELNFSISWDLCCLWRRRLTPSPPYNKDFGT